MITPVKSEAASEEFIKNRITPMITPSRKYNRLIPLSEMYAELHIENKDRTFIRLFDKDGNQLESHATRPLWESLLVAHHLLNRKSELNSLLFKELINPDSTIFINTHRLVKLQLENISAALLELEKCQPSQTNLHISRVIL